MTDFRKHKPLMVPIAPPDRPGRRAEDEYEQLRNLAYATPRRSLAQCALDESYVLTRLLQGRVPNELRLGLTTACPEAFKAWRALNRPVAAENWGDIVRAFINAYHAEHGLPRIDFTRRYRAPEA